ncbi:glutaminase [Bacillus coahuilensis p1.1.43]|uniref:Glutaminase n=1 Tax=Bacillus coahuilensis p1.1.43 TaxID=1150625 RepID=A0A147K3Z9_9BACI|nr:glutaminase [Bacillus coahuilensis]KUP04030.1 glutaminase [Bacillus coahuilensis p1.1.43]
MSFPFTEEQVTHYIKENRSHTILGQTAQYIPALARQDSSKLGIVVMDHQGETVCSGDWDVSFTLQSISKILSFISVCTYYGIESVLEKVDVEPTGEAFNSIIPFEIHRPGKPFNPLINAGAITVSSMLPGETIEDKFRLFLDFLEKLIGKRPHLDEEVYESEWNTAHRNRALAYYLKESNLLELEVEDALAIYLKQCSITVRLDELAKIGLIIAYNGVNPITGEKIFPKEVARIAKVLMVTCGMYNSSGKFAANVGIPAKSGVSGGIVASVPPTCLDDHSCPNQGYGIGVYGPAIDSNGNSTAGTMLLSQLSKAYDFSIF